MDSTASLTSEWEEIMGKDLMLKRIRSCDGKTAEMGTVVQCNLRGFFIIDDICQSEPFEEWNSQRFKVGENDAIPGIEMAVRFSRVGEVLRVKFKSKFGYGYLGRPIVVTNDGIDQRVEKERVVKKNIIAIPPDMDLEYEIEVTAHLGEGQIDSELLNRIPILPESVDRHVERLHALSDLLQRKEAGNRWFIYSDFSRAARAYSKATQIADRYFNGGANVGDSNAKALQGLSVTKGRDGDGEGQAASLAEANAALAAAEQEKEAQRRCFEQGDEEVVAGYISCLNNMAACQLKLGENAKAKEVCIRVLEVDPGNQKALLRAAKAALATHVCICSPLIFLALVLKPLIIN